MYERKLYIILYYSQMPDHARIITLKDSEIFSDITAPAVRSVRTRMSSTLLCSVFNGSCLVLVDLLVSEWHHYTLTNPHGGYWNDGTAHGPDTFEIPE